VEAGLGEPFAGPSGQKLNLWLAHANLRRSALWVDNVVRCWLPENRPPTAAERKHCLNAHVWPALRTLPELEVVVPVGVAAAKAVFGNDIKETVFGTVAQWSIPSE
jgi:uracil-DNA glycosylase family 4